jgi:putative ABC transport system substrate-binding protein
LGLRRGNCGHRRKGSAVVGFFSSNAPGKYAPAVAAFREGPAETGYIEGQNVAIDCRWAEGHYDRLPALAAELVEHEVEVIAAGSLTAIRHGVPDEVLE